MAELEERTPVHPRQRRLRRLLMVSACVAVSLALLWWRHINTVPRYAMPRPALPQPNAFDYYLSAGDALDSLRGYPLVQSPSTSPEYGTCCRGERGGARNFSRRSAPSLSPPSRSAARAAPPLSGELPRLEPPLGRSRAASPSMTSRAPWRHLLLICLGIDVTARHPHPRPRRPRPRAEALPSWPSWQGAGRSNAGTC